MNRKIAVIIGLLLITILIFGYARQKTHPDEKQIPLNKEKASEKILHIKIASLYERVTEGAIFNRSIDDTVNLLNETKTDFVLRGFWVWTQAPNTCNQFSSQEIKQRCELGGYSYEHLDRAISKIKAQMPDIIFSGAIPAQIVSKETTWNPETEEIIRYPDTWALATDPGKWKINKSKESFQCEFGKTQSWVPKDFNCDFYNPEEVSAYFPDITNPKFEELLLSWAERQIDSGADAIWIDMLFYQAGIFARITKDENHPAVKESYESASRIVDKIHAYGASKGKYIYVGSWATVAMYPYPPPDLDFVTVSPSTEEIKEMRLNEKRWDEGLTTVNKKFGNIPILAFIDWASTANTQLGVFSQNLSKEEQRKFLKTADDFFTKKGVIFVYPIHGGWMGEDATILAFGQSKAYDSLAPEFETYETIRELARNKVK